MNLYRLIHELYQPALITPEAHATIREIIEARLLEVQTKDRKPGVDNCGEEVPIRGMEIADGIASIPILGAIGQNLSPFERPNATDVDEVLDELAQAEADPEVRGIFLDFDSPGGMVQGTPETAEAMVELRTKPMVAFTSSMMASAAYWLGSSADAIFTTPTASTGSIGVYMPVIDSSERMKQFGIKVELIKSGRLKGMGFPGTSLTEDQRSHLQARVNKIHGMFTSAVQSRRVNATDKETFQGQTFMGDEAKERGLVDHIVKNRAEALNALRALPGF